MSSNDIAIKVEHLSKMYQMYDQPQDRLKQFIFPRLQRLTRKPIQTYFHEFWALHDVSFEVKKGETVGIIGRNGSGKSTLLQLICGTLTPTGGSVQTNGRVAALLELGSGFNPEFTGRENIYMNGTVLGLSTEEIDARFDEIAAFADIGEFIEQPIKTYSSGMLVRLAFAVIAHVDADILVIDEALAVGDAVFTQKCMRFLRRFMEKGTILFVSHDINSVNNLCRLAVWLDHGSTRMFSDSNDVTKAYTQFCNQQIYADSIKLQSLSGDDKSVNVRSDEKRIEPETRISFFEDIAHSDGWKTGGAEILGVSMTQMDGEPVTTMLGGEKVVLKIQAIIHQPLVSPIIGFLVKDRLGQSLFGEHTYTYTQPPCAVKAGERLEAEFIFSLPLLPNGEYSMSVSIADGDPYDHVQHHWLHEAMILTVQSPKLRYGLVGISFDSVSMSKRVS
jgi:homopolymeric O-antigen transport system ATP-binding protein